MSRAADSPTASPVSRGGALYGASSPVADRLPGGHRRGRRGPALEQGDQLGPVLGGDVERGEVQPVLGGGDDPGLVLPVERHHRLGALVPGDERDATRGRGDADSGPGSHAEQAPA